MLTNKDINPGRRPLSVLLGECEPTLAPGVCKSAASGRSMADLPIFDQRRVRSAAQYSSGDTMKIYFWLLAITTLYG